MLIDSLVNNLLNRAKGGNLGWLLTHSDELYADPMLPFAFNVRVDGVIPNTYVKEVNVPLPSHESAEILVEGRPMKIVSFMSNNDISITFYEDEFGFILKQMEQWRIKMYDPTTGTYGMPADYKKNIEVFTIDRDTQIGTQMVAKGAFPKSMTGYNFDTENLNRPTKLTVNFSIDAIYYSFTNKVKRTGSPLPFAPLGFLFGDMTTFDFSKGNWPWHNKVTDVSDIF